MISKSLVVIAIATLAVSPAQPQSRAADTAKQIKAGEVAQLGDRLAVKATQSTKSPFAGVKVKGEPLVVVIELDAGKKGATISYNLSADSRSSDLYLASGTQRNAPRAVVEDFPSWGSDNDKEVEVLDPKDSASSSSLKFEGKGSIFLLFDVPQSQARIPKKLSITVRTVEPRQEHHSLVVTL